MKIERTSDEVDLIPELKAGTIHVVAFAEEGFSFFKAYAEFALGFSVSQGVMFCDQINNADETGTLGPQGNLTAMPKRFFRNQQFDPEGFERCLRDAFIANRDFCKSKKMAFVFRCVENHLDEIYESVVKIVSGEFEDTGLEQVTVFFDR